MSSRPLRVFVSYAQSDRETAGLVQGHLKTRGIEVRSDRDIEPGESWDAAIESRLADSDAVLRLLPPVAVRSDATLDEAAFALRRAREGGAKVIPVLLDAIEPADVPIPLASLAWLDARNNDQESLLTRLDAALRPAT